MPVIDYSRKNHHCSGLPLHRVSRWNVICTLLPFFGAASLLFSPSTLYSQQACPTSCPALTEADEIPTIYCPDAPSSFTHGSYTVLEGRVISDGTDQVFRGHDAAVAIEDAGGDEGRFIIAWATEPQLRYQIDGQSQDDNQLIANRFASDGSCYSASGPQIISCRLCAPGSSEHAVPSIALTDGRVRVAWMAWKSQTALGLKFLTNPGILISDFAYDDDPATWPRFARSDPPETWNVGPSAGCSGQSANIRGHAWARRRNPVNPPPYGVLYEPPLNSETVLRSCSSTSICGARVDQFQPIFSMRNDGHFLIGYSYDVDPQNAGSSFDIRLQLFDPTGQKVGEEVTVNDPASEITDSTQNSPAVHFDDAGNIVVVWTGPPLTACPGSGNPEVRRIFARRLHWPPKSGDTIAAPGCGLQRHHRR